ncbi:reverse transcriptase [Lithospermum erythrorhizon]|uniref:Reverse transcriptase n=1 Tax=Lithospermum erythrorhizon TaxID=34254 RepID=A0AAV3RCJ0_LITER
MREGQLPMTYLGIPLFPNHLTREDYNVLIEKVCGKIDSWQAKHFSFAGRAHLVRSSIFGLQNFWCSSLHLPKYVIEVVEKRVRTFLWSSNGEGQYFSKVAWHVLCLPLKEGGLGFKCMRVWSEAYKKRDHDPWYWKTLLKIRPMLYEYFTVEPGNGKEVFFWQDPCSSIGSIWNWLTPNERSYLQVGADAKLADVVSISLPGLRRQTLGIRTVFKKLELVSLTDCEDRWVWKLSPDARFSQSSLWDQIRPRPNNVEGANWL